MKVRAYCLISGGVDSILAVKLLQLQGIETIGVHFKSFFFDKTQVVKQMSEDLNFELKILDITSDHLEIVKNPRYGYGKTMNPCVDCHALMLKKTGDLLDLSKKEFIATGEVLSQRPMSQNKNALELVEKVSEKKKLILRPLSAKLLPITIPEEKGWVDRELLLDISGRRRERQLQLLKEYKLPLYAWPAGGCRLTEETFSRKVESLKKKNHLNNLNLVKAMSFGRIMEIGEEKYIVISRKEKEGEVLETIPADFTLTGKEINGPMIIGWGNFNEADFQLTAQIFSFYSKAKGKHAVEVLLNQQERLVPEIDVSFIDREIKKRIL